MSTVQRSTLVEYSAGDMQSLVEDIESYPKFLPWCGATEILSREPRRVVASIKINFRGIHQQFTTENTMIRDGHIQMGLVSGPFRKFKGDWTFLELGENASKVSLSLDYELSNSLLQRVLGPVFHHIADSMVDAFVRRAESVLRAQ
jgi:ribosome-associated toxin RatA of RatAB toxin-antitoxin module